MSKYEVVNKLLVVLTTCLFLLISYICLGNAGAIPIEIRDSTGKIIQTIFSNQDGSFESDILPAGEYTLTIHPQNRMSLSKTVLITSGDQQCDFKLESSPLADVIIQLSKDGSAELLAQVTTKEDGTFEFDNVQPGKYQLNIRKQGYQNKIVPIDLKEGDTIEFIELLERENDISLPQGSPYEVIVQDSESLVWLQTFIEKGLAPGFPYNLDPQKEPILRIDAAVVLARVLGAIESKPVSLTGEEKNALNNLKEQFFPELKLLGAFGVLDSEYKLAIETKGKLHQIEREKEDLAKKQADLTYRLGTTSVVKVKSTGVYEICYDDNNDTNKLLDVTVRPELWVQSEPTADLSIQAVLRSFYNFAGMRGLSWRQFTVDYRLDNLGLTFGDYGAKLTPYTLWSYNPTPAYSFESSLDSLPVKVQLRERGLYDNNWMLRGAKAYYQRGPLELNVLGAPTIGKTKTQNGRFITAIKSELDIRNFKFGLVNVSLFDDKLSDEPQKGSMNNNVLSLITECKASLFGKELIFSLESAYSSYQETSGSNVLKANAISGALANSNLSFKLINNASEFCSLAAQSVGVQSNLHEFYTIGDISDTIEPEAFTFGQATPNRKGWIFSSMFHREGFLRGKYIVSLASASEVEASDSSAGIKKYNTWDFGFSRDIKAIPILNCPAKLGVGVKLFETKAERSTISLKQSIYGANLKIEPKKDFSVLIAFSQEQSKDNVTENKAKAGVQYHIGGPFSVIGWYTKMDSSSRKAELVNIQLDYEF